MCTASTAKRRRRKAKIDPRYSLQKAKGRKTVKWVALGNSGYMKKVKA